MILSPVLSVGAKSDRMAGINSLASHAGMTPAQLFLDHLPYIEKAVARLCRRYFFRKEEEEDFLSHVKIKLMENDYAVLRKFQGRCSFKTYLTTVISNLLKDYLNSQWGKWRPCAEAKRLGGAAIRLDELLNKEGIPFDEAVQILRINHRVEMSWQDLNEIRGRLPLRTQRHMEGEESLQNTADPAARADDRIIEEARAATLNWALGVLKLVLDGIPEEDRLILKMQGDQFKVSDIAKTLKLDQKQLYRRIDKLLKQLRFELERRGITRDLIREILTEWRHSDFSPEQE